MKKYVIYYNEKEEVVGYRERHFDWAEGETIITNGRQVAIFAIFDGTEKNLRTASNMLKTIKRYMPGQLNKKVWKNFDAILDYVDDVVCEIMD